MQVNHLRCLHEFVEAQAAYYAQCHKHMQELQKELSRCVEFLAASQNSHLHTNCIVSSYFGLG